MAKDKDTVATTTAATTPTAVKTGGGGETDDDNKSSKKRKKKTKKKGATTAATSKVDPASPASNNNNKKKKAKDKDYNENESGNKKETRQQQRKQKQQQQQQKKKPPDYNPRWKGYTLICLFALVNLSSISNIHDNQNFKGTRAVNLLFGVLTFALTSIVLLLDASQALVEKFNFPKACDGALEGYVLLFLTIFWIVGVGYLTQVGGVAYLAMNVYFSSWATLFACIYTLNKWSSSKDILTIAELTGLSYTLKSWYVLFLSSLVVMGTAINMTAVEKDTDMAEVIVGISFGGTSAILSCSFILVHYKLIEVCEEGGWTELAVGVFVVLLWIVGVVLITQTGSVGSTIVGSGCNARVSANQVDFLISTGEIDNCTIFVVDTNNHTFFYTCTEAFEQEVPGSNLFISTWLALASALNVCFRWKVQQAIAFAQAQQAKAFDKTRLGASAGSKGVEGDGDLDDFEDAAAY